MKTTKSTRNVNNLNEKPNISKKQKHKILVEKIRKQIKSRRVRTQRENIRVSYKKQNFVSSEWNICGINGKEPILNDIMLTEKIKIGCYTETKEHIKKKPRFVDYEWEGKPQE